MKIQCSCGAKYAFDVTPDMAQNPVQFICPSCSADISQTVNNLIRQEVSCPPEPAAGPRLRIHKSEPARTEPAVASTPEPGQLCAKHPNQPTTKRCLIC